MQTNPSYRVPMTRTIRPQIPPGFVKPFRFAIVISLAVYLAQAPSAQADILWKSSTTDPLNQLTSWWTTETGTANPAAIGTTDTLRFGGDGQGASMTSLTLGGNLGVGALRLDNGSGTPNYNVTVGAGNTLTLNGNTDYNGGYLSGIVLDAPTGGTLTVNSPLTVSASQTWVSARTLNVGGAVAIGANTLTLDATAGTTTVSGNISGTGAGGLTKKGSGTVILSGKNNYPGGTLVNGGTLTLTGGDFGTGIVRGTATVNNGGTLNVQSQGSVWATDTINVNSGGTFGLTGGDLGYICKVNLDSSTGTAAAVKSLDTGSFMRMGYNANGLVQSTGATPNTWNAGIQLVNGGGKTVTISTGAGNALTISGVIFDFSGLENCPFYKTGDGTLTLTKTNTYAGLTTVSGGTLALGASGSIANSSGVNLAAGAVFDSTAKTSYAIPAAKPVTIHLSGTAAGTAGRINAAGLDITNAAVVLTADNTLDDPVYILADYTSLTGSVFASLVSIPGYHLQYAYNGGTQIALVQGAVSYTVTYNGNASTGGSVPTDNNSPYAEGALVTVLGNTDLTRTGYWFTGWNTTADGSGSFYRMGDTFNISAANTLYAQWVANYGDVLWKNNTTGNLNLTTTWWTTETGTTNPTAIAIGDTLRFGGDGQGASMSLLLGRDLAVGALHLDNGTGTPNDNVTILAGNTLTLNGNQGALAGSVAGIVLDSATGGTLTINAPLMLGASQSWVSARALTIGGAVNLGASTLTLDSTAGTTTVSGNISGTGGLIKSGGGTAILSGTNNNYAGGTIINDGKLTLNSTIVGTPPFTINAGGTLDVLDVNALPGTLSQIMNVNGGGTLNASSANNQNHDSYLGTVNLDSSAGTGAQVTATNNGGFRLGYRGNSVVNSSGTVTNTWSASFRLVNNGVNSVTISTSAANTLMLSGVILDYSDLVGLPLNKSGDGTLLLTNTNTYTGATRVNAGTLALGASGSIANSSGVTIGAGATLDTTAKTSYTLPSAVTIGLNGTAGTCGTVNATGKALNVSGATLTFNVTGTLSSPVFVLANYGSISGSAAFASVTNLPTDYTINYTYNGGTQIALVNGVTDPFTSWITTNYPGLSDKTTTGDPDGDLLTNLQEFAFGTDPTASTGEIVYSGGTLTTPGVPKLVAAGGTYSMVFGRRADYVAAGLTYTVQFSADLDTWVDNNDLTNPPVQVATDGTIDAMSVPYVDFITTPSGTQKPTFSRVKVEMAP
jgi:fibronectin-binding autotransporter adhesin